MAMSGGHRAAVRSWPNTAANTPDKPARYRRRELIATAGGAVLLMVIAVLSGWAHHSLSTVRPVLPSATATPPASALVTPMTSESIQTQLRAWLTQAEPSIDALVSARDGIAAAAASDDIAGTGAACQTADSAVASLQQHMPSPDPGLNTALQQAMSSYHVGLSDCISGARNQDGDDIGQAVPYINRGNADLQAAVDILERDLSDSAPPDPGVMIV